MKKPIGFGEKHLPEILAVVLVCALAIGLGSQWMGDGIRAQTSSSGSATITAELTDEQPLQIGQLPDQWLARFKLSTTSQAEITITAITFYAEGNLRYQFTKRAGIVPLSVRQGAILLGQGSEWTVPYGLALQQVALSVAPITLTSEKPATFDVYADLSKLNGYTFGLDLGRVEASIPTDELSVIGRLYKIKKLL
jgi:hypothetical protein